MAASPSSVLTRGLGSWGSVNLMPTLGYGSSNAAAFANLWFTLGNERTEFTLPKAPDATMDDSRTEFTLEAP